MNEQTTSYNNIPIPGDQIIDNGKVIGYYDDVCEPVYYRKQLKTGYIAAVGCSVAIGIAVLTFGTLAVSKLLKDNTGLQTPVTTVTVPVLTATSEAKVATLPPTFAPTLTPTHEMIPMRPTPERTPTLTPDEVLDHELENVVARDPNQTSDLIKLFAKYMTDPDFDINNPHITVRWKLDINEFGDSLWMRIPLQKFIYMNLEGQFYIDEYQILVGGDEHIIFATTEIISILNIEHFEKGPLYIRSDKDEFNKAVNSVFNADNVEIVKRERDIILK